MSAKDAIKFRAMKMAIATGDMPDVEFIWSIQRAEGSRQCFGQGLGCQERGCCWRSKCIALDFFADVSLASLAGWPKNEDISKQSQTSEECCIETNPLKERASVQAGTLELVSGGSGRT